ncbi:MAG: trimeric intracellular cation channel family protein [Rhodanobacteraceae bacterium]|nr:MAG: trimeric intracellular cation channel family protein [Rhodanobacteraceae bacterium]
MLTAIALTGSTREEMIHILLVVLDLGGTFVFAISGAVTAVRHRLDIFGVMVLAFAAGNAGGITRDLLIGAVPPAAIASLSYVGVSILAGFIVFFWNPLITKLDHPVQWFDAIGLAFFAVAGAEKALVFHLNPVMAALLGMLTGIGGGMLRDVLVREIPVVLRADLYALAALAGAAVVVAGHVLHVSAIASTIVGGLLCFALRYGAIRHGWHLPAARVAPATPGNADTPDDHHHHGKP